MAEQDQNQAAAAEPDEGKAPFIKKILDQADLPTEIVMLKGFLGDGPNDQTVRLYRNGNLSEWVDIPVKKIVHRQPLSSDVVAIWIGRREDLRHTSTKSILAEEFLSGSIAAGYITPGMEATRLGPVEGAVYPVPRSRYCHQSTNPYYC